MTLDSPEALGTSKKSLSLASFFFLLWISQIEGRIRLNMGKMEVRKGGEKITRLEEEKWKAS